MTIKDIARIAGVAKSTVSEVINNDPKSRVSPKTFEKVQKIIRQYNYTPLPMAQALNTNRTRHLGFLVSSTAMLGLANSYFSPILAGIEAACSERDYRCTVSRYDLSSVRDFVMPAKLKHRSIDALFIAGRIEATLDELTDQGIPITIIGSTDDPHCFRISNDMIRSYEAMFKYLAELGHRRILIPYFEQDERKEILAGLEFYHSQGNPELEIGLTDAHQDQGDFYRGMALVDTALNDPAFRDCTALLSNDQICCGFMQEFLYRGYCCPEDYSIMSTSESQNCQWNAIPLTSRNSCQFEHGYASANLIIDLLEGLKNEGEVRQKMQEWYRPNELIIRRSTGPARRKKLPIK